jgi:hypothetical protein
VCFEGVTEGEIRVGQFLCVGGCHDVLRKAAVTVTWCVLVHNRMVFAGSRLHGVCWLTRCRPVSVYHQAFQMVAGFHHSSYSCHTACRYLAFSGCVPKRSCLGLWATQGLCVALAFHIWSRAVHGMVSFGLSGMGLVCGQPHVF